MVGSFVKFDGMYVFMIKKIIMCNFIGKFDEMYGYDFISFK